MGPPAATKTGIKPIVGIEAYYPEYEPDTRLELVERARQAGLIPSGGSDYHGGYKPGLRIGNGYGDLVVEQAVVEELRTARSGTPGISN